MDDEPVFVAAEIEYDPVVSHEIDSAAELPFNFARITPCSVAANLRSMFSTFRSSVAGWSANAPTGSTSQTAQASRQPCMSRSGASAMLFFAFGSFLFEHWHLPIMKSQA